MNDPILQEVHASFCVDDGITIYARVSGTKMPLDELEEIASNVGDEPHVSLAIAWPGRGREDPEAKLLREAGILETGGSIGGGMSAVSGPRCKQFYDEVCDYDRWDKLRETVRNLVNANSYSYISETDDSA